MEIVKVNPLKPEKAVLKKAANVLKKGGVIVYPTETVYGLGANIFNKKAVQKIFQIKGRTFKKPLSVAVRNFKDATKVAKFNLHAKKIFKKFLPGPLTIVLPKKNCVSNLITANQKTVAVRVPDSKVVLRLLEICKFPITSTSANISGRRPPESVREVIKQFRKKKIQPDLILDAGKTTIGKPSTIVDLTGKVPKILRRGPLKLKNLVALM
jgi:L-threonylcarbamoyladenylate synthase